MKNLKKIIKTYVFWNGENVLKKDAQYEKEGEIIFVLSNDNQTACNNTPTCYFGSEWEGGEENSRLFRDRYEVHKKIVLQQIQLVVVFIKIKVIMDTVMIEIT